VLTRHPSRALAHFEYAHSTPTQFPRPHHLRPQRHPSRSLACPSSTPVPPTPAAPELSPKMLSSPKSLNCAPATTPNPDPAFITFWIPRSSSPASPASTPSNHPKIPIAAHAKSHQKLTSNSPPLNRWEGSVRPHCTPAHAASPLLCRD
jgi:hypothetical protein